MPDSGCGFDLSPLHLSDSPKSNENLHAIQDKSTQQKIVIDSIAKFSPNFKDLILHAEVRTPAVIESEIGLPSGNISQGDLSFDQLMFNRPFPGYAQYRGPVKGMYMCGSATHPGGGITGQSGRLAAGQLVKDLKKQLIRK